MGKFVIGKTTFWATSRMFTSPFDTIFRVRGRRERGREGLRGEDCDSACDGHVYPGGGRKGRRVITDWSGELLRWMPDNKLLQDQFLEFEESWPSCGKKMRGRKDGVEGSGRPTVTRTSKASSPFQHSSLILSELLSRSGRGISFSRFQSSTWRIHEEGDLRFVSPLAIYRKNCRVVSFRLLTGV